MNGEVIKSFLVGLGFGVDDSSLSKFNKAIASAGVKVAALYASIKLTASAIVFSISKISEGFEQMGYEYRIIAPAINKTLMLRREMLKAYEAAGINITKVVQQSVLLNFSLAKTKFAFEAIYRSVASRFFPLITKQSDIFRQKLYANMPKIQAALERFVNFIFKAFEATVQLGTRIWSILTRVYDFFAKLHDATDGWSTVILGVAAAWKILNLSFLATPLGMLLTGLVALLALYDDFKTYQEGGKSLFDWSSFLPVIDAVTDALKSLRGVLDQVFQTIFALFDAFYHLIHLDFSGFADRIGLAFESITQYIKNLISTFGSLLNIRSSLKNWGINVLNSALTPAVSNPVGSAVQNSQTNQNVDQQTSIIVQGSADANSTAKAVAGEQSRVNFDMVRNMKGATR